MDNEALQKEAAALRAALSPINPKYATLSDGDVIRYAAQEPETVVGPVTKRRLRETFSDGAGTTFLKGVGRGIGLDLPLAGVDKVLGTNTQSYLNEDVLTDHPGMAMAGNLVGGLAGFVIPGGALVKGAQVAKAANLARSAKLAPAAMAAGIGAYQNVSQGLGQQLLEQASGDRTKVDPTNLAVQGIVGAAGNALLPGAGSALKQAALSAGENAVQSAASVWNNDRFLTPEAQLRTPGMVEAAIQGGAFGGLLGPAAHVAGKVLRRSAPTGAPAPTVPPPAAAPGPPSPVPRAGASPQPVVQPPPPPLPGALATPGMKQQYDQVRQFAAEGKYDQLKAAGQSFLTTQQLEQLTGMGNKLLDSPKIQSFIDPDTQMAIPMVRLKGNEFDKKGTWWVQDVRPNSPTHGKWIATTDDMMAKYHMVEQDTLGFEQVVRPMADRPMYNGAKEPVLINGRAAIPVGVQRKGRKGNYVFEVSVVYPDSQGKVAQAEKIVVDATKDYPYGANNQSFYGVLSQGVEVDKSNRQARMAKRRQSAATPWHQGQVMPELPDVLTRQQQALDEVLTLGDRFSQNLKGQKP